MAKCTAVAVSLLMLVSRFGFLTPSGSTNTSELPQSISARAERPDPSLFESGDLIWPKAKTAFVPYDSRSHRSTEDEKRQWEQEKRAYLAGFSTRPDLSSVDKARFTFLSELTFEQFVNVYLGDLEPNANTNFAGNSLVYVGHVGIIHVRESIPWVTEAVMGIGVRTVKYSTWLDERPDELVWLGRLADETAAARRTVAEIAAKYVGRPYNFWDFDLANDSDFYCSKLAWWSIVRATGRAPDNNTSPARHLWFSPKQLMKSPAIRVLFSPASYAGPKR